MKKILGLGFKLQTVFFLVVCLVLFTSCATTVKFPVQRPAQIDSKGARAIAVLPFPNEKLISFYNNYYFDAESIASYIQTKLQDRVSETDFFTLVMNAPVLKALQSGTKPPCDMYITGSIYNVSNKLNRTIIKEDEKEENHQDKNKKEKKQILYSRSVSLSINYKIVYTATGQILYSTTQDIQEESAEYHKKQEVPSFFSMIQHDLDYKTRNLVQKLIPYTTTRSITLLKNTSKDSIIEAQMENANQLAKDGLTNQAQAAFAEIYQNTGNFEAGYNAALLLEAIDHLDKAAEQMNQLYIKTRHKKAEKALKEILKEIEYEKQLQGQLDAKNRSTQN